MPPLVSSGSEGYAEEAQLHASNALTSTCESPRRGTNARQLGPLLISAESCFPPERCIASAGLVLASLCAGAQLQDGPACSLQRAAPADVLALQQYQKRDFDSNFLTGSRRSVASSHVD